jgi:hypothetical protein
MPGLASASGLRCDRGCRIVVAGVWYHPHVVTLDYCMRPYIYSLRDVMYAPGCSARLLATLPEADKGNHFRSNLMIYRIQTRSDGASLPFFASEGHCGGLARSFSRRTEIPASPAHRRSPRASGIWIGVQHGPSPKWEVGTLIGASISCDDWPCPRVLHPSIPRTVRERGSTFSYTDDTMPVIPPPPAPEFTFMCQDAESSVGCSAAECPYAHSERVMDARIASRNRYSSKERGEPPRKCLCGRHATAAGRRIDCCPPYCTAGAT